MLNRQKRIHFTIFGGLVLLLVSITSSSFAQAPTVDFAGTWNTVTGKGKKITIRLESVRRTATVSGTYGREGLMGSYQPLDHSADAFAFVKVSAFTSEPLLQTPNTIRGTVTENVLRFKWQENSDHGAGRFTLSPDGQSFEGTFSMTENPDDTSGGTWNGTRAPYFAGAWRGKLGEGAMEVIFQQTGSQVTGQIRVNSADLGMIRESIIDGNTLRFQVWRPGRKISPNGINVPEYAGTGELVMDKDGKSFKGNILGAATSGTLIARPGRS